MYITLNFSLKFNKKQVNPQENMIFPLFNWKLLFKSFLNYNIQCYWGNGHTPALPEEI